jgi:nucleotide-binding universal stress UspA family protein
MKATGTTFKSLRPQTLLFVILLAATSVFAQDQRRSAMTDPRMVVIPVRGLDEIRNDIENVQVAKQLAAYREAQASNRLKEIESTIESRKTDLKVTDIYKDDAKKGERQPEMVSLQTESKAGQKAIDLLKRLADLRKAEIEVAQVEGEVADVEIRALQMEDELQTKRMGYDSLSTTGMGDLTQSTAEQVLRELEVSLLKLQQDQAGATQKLASKQNDVVTRRMELHEAQLKFGMPRM